MGIVLGLANPMGRQLVSGVLSSPFLRILHHGFVPGYLATASNQSRAIKSIEQYHPIRNFEAYEFNRV